MKEVTGIIPPVMTPFKENGEPDLDAFEGLLDFLESIAHFLNVPLIRLDDVDCPFLVVEHRLPEEILPKIATRSGPDVEDRSFVDRAYDLSFQEVVEVPRIPL